MQGLNWIDYVTAFIFEMKWYGHTRPVNIHPLSNTAIQLTIQNIAHIRNLDRLLSHREVSRKPNKIGFQEILKDSFLREAGKVPHCITIKRIIHIRCSSLKLNITL